MQPVKSLPSGQQKLPETRFTEFPELSVNPRLGVLGLYQGPMIDCIYLVAELHMTDLHIMATLWRENPRLLA